MHTESSHGRSVSLSDFGDMNRRLSTAEKFGKSNIKTNLAADLDRDFISASTPRLKRSDMPERPRSTFLDRYAKPSPPFQRPQNPVAKMMDKDSAKKPGVSTVPRSFKDSTQLFHDLGISSVPERHQHKDTPARNQSFRLPDMTGIHSLIDTSPRITNQKRSPLPHIPLESVPIPQNEKGKAKIGVYLFQISFLVFELCRTRSILLLLKKVIRKPVFVISKMNSDVRSLCTKLSERRQMKVKPICTVGLQEIRDSVASKTLTKPLSDRRHLTPKIE